MTLIQYFDKKIEDKKPRTNGKKQKPMYEELLIEILDIYHKIGWKKIAKSELQQKLYIRLLRSGRKPNIETIPRYLRRYVEKGFLRRMKVGRQVFYTINSYEIKNYLYSKLEKKGEKK